MMISDIGKENHTSRKLPVSARRAALPTRDAVCTMLIAPSAVSPGNQSAGAHAPSVFS